ncbi:MAG: hypothetical protein AAGI11_01980 [Pseudomonadota bacterium]
MEERFLIARINHSHAGFFAYVTFALNQACYAWENGFRPVVHFGPRSGNGKNAFYSEKHGSNMWDYYFEPVDGITFEQLMERITDPQDSLTRDNVGMLNNASLWALHNKRRQSIFSYPYGDRRGEKIDEAWYRHEREKANKLVEKGLCLKPHIAEHLARTRKELFASTDKVIGVHIRGTDKGSAEGPNDLMRIVPPSEYYPHIDALLDKGYTKIFVATDQTQFLNDFKARYASRACSIDVLRGDSDVNPFEVDDDKGYQKGLEVLLDCLLLSGTDYLLKCTSAVGEFAHYLNPALEGIDLNLANRGSPEAWEEVEIKRSKVMSRVKEGPGGQKRSVRIPLSTSGRDNTGYCFHDLQCATGLGDRLLDSWAAISLMRLAMGNTPIKLNWEDGRQFPGFKAVYDTSLFSLQDVEFVDAPPAGALSLPRGFSMTEKNEKSWHKLEDKNAQFILQTGAKFAQNPPPTLHAQRNWYGLNEMISETQFVNAFIDAATATKPSPLVETALPTDIEGRFGIHIRLQDKLTDYPPPWEMDEIQFRHIETRLIKHATQLIEDGKKLFVCSDDSEYMAEFIALLQDSGGDVITSSPDATLVEKVGGHAVLDYFALSRCKAVIQGTRFSTFSLAASLMGRRTLVNLDRGHSLRLSAINNWRSTHPSLKFL